MGVQEIPVQHEHCAHLLDHITFADCYQASPVHQKDLVDIYWNIFAHSPDWVTQLMRIRNKIAAKFGLKAASAEELGVTPKRPKPENVQVGQKLGMFHVLSLNENEIVTGEDDKHLDFRIILRRSGANEIQMTTVVKTHNTLGKTYMALIKPFHKLIARTMISSALKAGRL